MVRWLLAIQQKYFGDQRRSNILFFLLVRRYRTRGRIAAKVIVQVPLPRGATRNPVGNYWLNARSDVTI